MRKSQLTFSNNQVGCIIMTYSWKKGMSIDSNGKVGKNTTFR